MAGLIPFNKRAPNFLSSSDFRNMLDDFFTDSWLPSRNLMRDTFKIDVEETDKEYSIYAELPGIQKNEIGLDINEGKLTISVNRQEHLNEDKKNYIHRERRSMSMNRSIYLADAKTDSIKAKLEDGILKVNVPKQEKTSNLIKINIE